MEETDRTGNACNGRLLYTCHRLDSAKRKLDRLAPAVFYNMRRTRVNPESLQSLGDIARSYEDVPVLKKPQTSKLSAELCDK